MAKLIFVASRSFHRSTALCLRGPLVFDGWYPRDHKPGPYPENEAERKAAAVKYGMRPEDYTPLDKDDVRRYAGDYPDLGTLTFDHKDPYESWTDPHHRRNWGELVQMDMMRYRGDRLTFTGLEAEDYTWYGAIFICLRVLIPMGLIFWYVAKATPNSLHWKNPVMPKQYSYDYYRAWPWNNPREYPIVNYTFEPLE